MLKRSRPAVDAAGSELLERLAALERLDLPRLPRPVFERLTRAATEMTGAPVGLAVLVDDERSAYVAHSGLAEPWASMGEAPISQSLCRLVAESGMPLVVADAREDERVRDHVAVRELGVAAYAGMPLRVGGVCVGSLCLVDGAPRAWSADQLLQLGALADAATAELDRHVAGQSGGAPGHEARYRELAAATDVGATIQDRFGAIDRCNPAAERILGLTAEQMMGRSSLDRRWRSIHADGREMPGTEHPTMRTLDAGIPLRDEVMGICKPSGELTWVSVCTEPVFDQHGETEWVIATFTDITSRMQVVDQPGQD